MFFSMSGESHDAMLRYISYLIQRYEAGSASDAELEHIIAYYMLRQAGVERQNRLDAVDVAACEEIVALARRRLQELEKFRRDHHQGGDQRRPDGGAQ